MEEYDPKNRNIEYLLRKYKNKHPNECWSKNYEASCKKEYRLNKKIKQAEKLGQQLYLTKDQINRVLYIVRKVGNLKKLHRTLGDEEIIFIICYFIKQQDHDDFRQEQHSLCREFSYIHEISFRKVLVNISKYILNH